MPNGNRLFFMGGHKSRHQSPIHVIAKWRSIKTICLGCQLYAFKEILGSGIVYTCMQKELIHTNVKKKRQ